MGKIYLKDPEGKILAEANYGADFTPWGLSPEGDDVRLPDYANDGYILPLEITDARKQLQKVINERVIHSGGPLGLGGYGGSSKLFLQPSMLIKTAPSDAECYTTEVTVELEEPYRICEGTFLMFNTGCSEPTATKREKMWMQWKDGKVTLSQNPYLPECPVPPAPTPPPPPPPPAPAEKPPENIASHDSLFDSLITFLGTPLTTAISALFTKAPKG